MATDPLTLPCLRGTFGDWIYYAALVPMREVVDRVHFATEFHKSKELSKLIQRQLEGDRARKIAAYLKGNDERFFNSLVLATYAGSPEWYDIGNLRSSKNADILEAMPEGGMDALGLLRLAGSEKIFALDGQHRLAGMQLALKTDDELGGELVPVILVGHATDAAGSRRTRRLFTTLNKTAIKVKKLEIIALDEDDAMAITARRMVEQDVAFKHPKIAVISSESMPVTNQDSLITIAALYDLLRALFRNHKGTASDYELRFNRPSDAELDAYHKLATGYFAALGKAFPPIAELMAARKPVEVVRKYRTGTGGHVLFRTVGLDIFTQAAIAISKQDDISIAAAVAKLKVLPTRLDREPFTGTIWDPTRKVIKPLNKVLARKVVFYMLGLPLSARQRGSLLGDYRAALGYQRTDTTAQLPARLV
jgi:DNA sulfur modification protein DndB